MVYTSYDNYDPLCNTCTVCIKWNLAYDYILYRRTVIVKVTTLSRADT